MYLPGHVSHFKGHLRLISSWPSQVEASGTKAHKISLFSHALGTYIESAMLPESSLSGSFRAFNMGRNRNTEIIFIINTFLEFLVCID